jgi:hypothetical protein
MDDPASLMWPTTARWAATVTRGHDLLSYADLLADGDTAATTLGSADLLLVAAHVTVGTGAIRRTATLTLVDTAGQLAPVVDKGLIIPGAGEVRLWAGMRYWDWTPADQADGTDVEYVPVFTGPVTDYDLSDYPLVRLGCSDRMWYCGRPFSAPYTAVATATLDDSIASLLAFKVPPAILTTNIPSTDLTTGLLVADERADPTDLLKRLSTAAGWSLYVDPMGTFTASTEAALDPANVAATYSAGPGGALVQPKLSGSADGIVNTWVVTGEAADNATTAVPWAKVTDDDPTSLTYVRGSYDERPRFISSPILKTDAQCLLAAQTYRARERGVADSVSLDVAANAALERGDVLGVAGGLVNRLVLADSFDLDLFDGRQTITGRSGVAAAPDA